MKDIIFIGGIFTSSQHKMILSESTGVIQNAADVLQKNLLKGLINEFEENVYILNLPFVGSYPNRFKTLYFPKTEGEKFCGVAINGIAFNNFMILKYFSRFINLLISLKSITSTKKDTIIYIYSYHLPFILASILTKFFRRNKIEICLMIPDLPEYMNDKGGFFYNFFKKLENKIGSFSLKFIDKYIVLTEYMATKLNIDKSKYLVIEGISDLDNLNYKKYINENKKYIFYSGTLAERYGIKKLLDIFVELRTENVELWICGEGDSKNYIQNISKNNKKIKYLGQLDREEVIKLQQNALFLVNPRQPEGEFTKYSFPSKIIEYMLSGRPVLMFKLTGIPDEYYQFCYYPKTNTLEEFAKTMKYIMNLSEFKLKEKGVLAKKFIVDEKSYLKQGKKIKEFLLTEC